MTDFLYMMLADTSRAEAQRHQRRGDAHAASGHQDWAAGSYGKRDKWLARAEVADIKPPRYLIETVINLSRFVEDGIYRGLH